MKALSLLGFFFSVTVFAQNPLASLKNDRDSPSDEAAAISMTAAKKASLGEPDLRLEVFFVHNGNPESQGTIVISGHFASLTNWGGFGNNIPGLEVQFSRNGDITIQYDSVCSISLKNEGSGRYKYDFCNTPDPTRNDFALEVLPRVRDELR